jgi:hypothetical protein
VEVIYWTGKTERVHCGSVCFQKLGKGLISVHDAGDVKRPDGRPLCDTKSDRDSIETLSAEPSHYGIIFTISNGLVLVESLGS